MDLRDRITVITGGTGGIGLALAKAFKAEGARAVVIADLDAERVEQSASELGIIGHVCDVTNEDQVHDLVEKVESEIGPIDLFCSNAGAAIPGVLTDADNDIWQQQWELHVMAHLYAARAVIPSMTARGEGYLLNTVSAAGLLAAIGSGPYSVTKAAAVKLAELLAINHGDDGIVVSIICPQGVNTEMMPDSAGDGAADGIIEPEELAVITIEGVRDERFLILPHPEVGEYTKFKANEPDKWLGAMRRMRRRTAPLD